MLSPTERKKLKLSKSLLPSFGSDMKQYDEIYQLYCREGYTKELCDTFADVLVDNCKKPAADDVVQLASLYNRIYDYKSADFYLDMLSDKKLASEERYGYCLEKLSTASKLGHWRDAEDFRTENINFIQNYMQKKKTPEEQVGMYIALALVDCSAKRYSHAFRLLNFGYKPKGKNDKALLDILTTAVYINAASGNEEGIQAAVATAKAALKLFSSFEFDWCREYFEKRIENAANGII